MTSEDSNSPGVSGRVGILLMQAPGEPPFTLAPIATGLARAGYVVRRVQPAALTTQGGNPTCWQDWYAEAEKELADLRQTCNVVIAGGMAAGAALGLLLAANHPTGVQGTALFAPTLWLNGRITPRAAQMVCLALGRRVAEMVGISRWLAPCSAAPAEPWAERRRLLQAARSTLKNIAQPALIVHSRQDRCAGLDNAGYLQRHLRGRVDMVVLGGANTGGLERQHDVVVGKATAFIEPIARKFQVPAPMSAAGPRHALATAA